MEVRFSSRLRLQWLSKTRDSSSNMPYRFDETVGSPWSYRLANTSPSNRSRRLERMVANGSSTLIVIGIEILPDLQGCS